MISEQIYDRIGRGYGLIRREDPRLAEAIWSALGDARTVVNVGAGTGSYEPRDRAVIAIEPSQAMIAQRAKGLAPLIKARAEDLPLGDDSVDAAMAVLTIQHWDDVNLGISEMLRVARQRVLVVTMDINVLAELWLARDYAPEVIPDHGNRFPSIAFFRQTLPNTSVIPLLVPRDCRDGFMAAFWARPEAYLEPEIRHATSVWHQLPPGVAERALNQLREDLVSGEWDRRYGHLRAEPALDVGLRLVCAELGDTGKRPALVSGSVTKARPRGLLTRLAKVVKKRTRTAWASGPRYLGAPEARVAGRDVASA